VRSGGVQRSVPAPAGSWAGPRVKSSMVSIATPSYCGVPHATAFSNGMTADWWVEPFDLSVSRLWCRPFTTLRCSLSWRIQIEEPGFGGCLERRGLCCRRSRPGWPHVYDRNPEIGRNLIPERPHAWSGVVDMGWEE